MLLVMCGNIAGVDPDSHRKVCSGVDFDAKRLISVSFGGMQKFDVISSGRPTTARSSKTHNTPVRSASALGNLCTLYCFCLHIAKYLVEQQKYVKL